MVWVNRKSLAQILADEFDSHILHQLRQQMKLRYRLVYSQGQGSGKSEKLFKSEARDMFLSCLGSMSVGLKKDGKLLSLSEICKEFDFDEVTLNEYTKTKMKLNYLFGKLKNGK